MRRRARLTLDIQHGRGAARWPERPANAWSAQIDSCALIVSAGAAASSRGVLRVVLVIDGSASCPLRRGLVLPNPIPIGGDASANTTLESVANTPSLGTYGGRAGDMITARALAIGCTDVVHRARRRPVIGLAGAGGRDRLVGRPITPCVSAC